MKPAANRPILALCLALVMTCMTLWRMPAALAGDSGALEVDSPLILQAQVVPFPRGQKYPVYQGPGKAYARSGNGKASVSTNDWIQVFGEENGWLMVQYQISQDHLRIGWIRPERIPWEAGIQPLNFSSRRETLAFSCPITDDPLYFGSEITVLPLGTPVDWIASLGGYAYVQAQDGRTQIRGFLPFAALGVRSPEVGSYGSSTYTPPASGMTCFVDNPNPRDRLHLRSQPSAQSTSLGKYYNGVQPTVLSEAKGGWVQVRIGSLTGYMNTEYLRFDRPVASAIPTVRIQNGNGSGLHLRSAQSTSSQSLGLYPNGTPVAVWGLTDRWCHVMTMDGQMGFMRLSGFEHEISYKLYDPYE